MYRVLFNGCEILCETTDEAVAFCQAAPHAVSEGVHLNFGNGSGQWTRAKYQSFVSSLNQKQRTMLRELVRKPGGVSAFALRQTLGAKSNQSFGPILSWMAHRAKKVGMTLQDVLVSQRKMANDVEITAFRAVPSFIEIAGEGKDLNESVS